MEAIEIDIATHSLLGVEWDQNDARRRLRDKCPGECETKVLDVEEYLEDGTRVSGDYLVDSYFGGGLSVEWRDQSGVGPAWKIHVNIDRLTSAGKEFHEQLTGITGNSGPSELESALREKKLEPRPKERASGTRIEWSDAKYVYAADFLGERLQRITIELRENA